MREKRDASMPAFLRKYPLVLRWRVESGAHMGGAARSFPAEQRTCNLERISSSGATVGTSGAAYSDIPAAGRPE